jgi:hypothetical protein
LLRTTSNTNLSYRLADNLPSLTDSEVQHLIRAIAGNLDQVHLNLNLNLSGWPGDSAGSESLNKVLTQLDGGCSVMYLH